ncbi:MAG: dual specificity protein phosphatase family protein [Planctomycetota bacterium]
MKYAIAFVITSLSMGVVALDFGGLWLLLFWPSSVFFSLAIAYTTRSPAVFGKQVDGSINLFGKFYMFPYLLLLHGIWNLVRWVSREKPINKLNEKIAIGRRLLPSELPKEIKNIIDLTCEFEIYDYGRQNLNYISFPILDGSTVSPDNLKLIAAFIDELDGKTFIHSAQGHGRTGMVAAAYLLYTNPKLNSESALDSLKLVRPRLNCNRDQIAALRKIAG